MKIRASIGLLLCFLICSCGGSRKTLRQPADFKSNTPEKAVEHFLNGALLDFQDQPREAIFEYRKALAYDSTSAQILKAIGRDLFRLGQYENSIGYLRRSYQHQPEDKETLYFLAEANYKVKDYENALFYYDQLNKIDPFNPTVHSSLIYLYTKLGKVNELLDLRERLVELMNGEDEFVYQLLTLYIQLNRLEKAHELIDEMLDKEPESPDNWVLYGNLLEMANDTTGAINAYKKALNLDGNDEKTLNHIYLLYVNRQDWNGLIHTFSGIVAADSLNHRARLYLAEGHFFLDNFQKARETVLPLLEDEQLRDRAYLLMGRIAASQNLFEEAKGYFQELATLEPWNSRAWEFLAVLLFQEEAYEKCAALLGEALEFVPNDPVILSLYGSALQQLDRAEEALAPLEASYRLDPENLNTISTLGIIYNDLAMYARLDSLYDAALAIYPTNALLLNNYSYSLGERGVHLERALEMARRALERDPQNGAYLDTIGWIYYKLGNYPRALEYLQQAAAQMENSPEVLEHLGDVYFQLKERDKARHYWQTALDQSPNNEALKIKLQQ